MSAYSLVYVCVNPYTRQRQKKKREDTYSGPKIHNDVEQDIYTNVNQAQQQSQIQGKKEGRNLTVKGKKAQCWVVVHTSEANKNTSKGDGAAMSAASQQKKTRPSLKKKKKKKRSKPLRIIIKKKQRNALKLKNADWELQHTRTRTVENRKKKSKGHNAHSLVTFPCPEKKMCLHTVLLSICFFFFFVCLFVCLLVCFCCCCSMPLVSSNATCESGLIKKNCRVLLHNFLFFPNRYCHEYMCLYVCKCALPLSQQRNAITNWKKKKK